MHSVSKCACTQSDAPLPMFTLRGSAREGTSMFDGCEEAYQIAVFVGCRVTPKKAPQPPGSNR
jgi:hypothetical protein